MQKDAAEKMLKKAHANKVRFLHATNIGIIVTTKSGQQQYKPSKALQKKYPDKKFYTFVTDTVDFGQLENFPFIEAWVNTACPRIGYDDVVHIRQAIVNLSDTLLS